MNEPDPAEQEELRRLDAYISEEEQHREGAQAVEAARPRPDPRPATSPFNLWRTGANIVRNVVNDALELGHTFYEYQSGRYLTEQIFYGREAANRLYQSRSFQFAGPEGTDRAGTAERIVTEVGSFMVPFTGFLKAFNGVRALSRLGRVGGAIRGVLAGATTDFSRYDAASHNFANFVTRDLGVSVPVLNSLAADPDDSAITLRFKAAASGIVPGIVGETVFGLAGRGVEAYRAWRSSRDAADGIVDSLRRDYALREQGRNLPEPEAAPAGATERPQETPGPNPSRTGEEAASEAPGRPEGSPEEAPRPQPEAEAQPTTPRPAEVRTPEDVLAYLREQTGDSVPDHVLKDIASKLIDGDPGDAFARLGIDPAKINFSSLDDPETLRYFHEALADVVGRIANRLGRTGTRVTEEATHTAARVLATTDDALRELYGNTANLAEILTAGRIIVQGHAQHLLGLADAAMAELREGGPGKAWALFEEAFDRHAYYQGALRGAKSEVGRALRSLQISKVNSKAVVKRLGKAAQAEAADQAIPGRLADDAGHWLRDLQTDAERIDALRRIQQAGGDIGDLTRTVRVKSMSLLKRIDLAVRETAGNFFSLVTGTQNTISGLSMLGLRSAERLLSAMGRAPFALFNADSAAAMRFHLLDAITYADGALTGWGQAFKNVAALLQRELGAEVALHANALGLDKLAKSAATAAYDANARLRGANFQRIDVVNNRAFALTPDEDARLLNIIRNTSAADFFTSGLKGLVKSGVASAVNNYGMLARSGTILFVNAPDELVGTLAAKAGAQSQALRIAAREAAEMQITGKDLTAYLKARAYQLSRNTEGWDDLTPFEKGQREAVLAAGHDEAKEVLFQDELETTAAIWLNKAHVNVPGASLVVAFLKTPMRILERTAIDYTPLGLLKDRMRRAILAGGIEGDEAKARLALGLILSTSAYMLAKDRTVVGNDGGPSGSARLDRTRYSLRIGNSTFQFNRIDPIGTLLGWGADLSAAMDASEDDITRQNMFAEVIEAMAWATAANVLSKSWLTDVRQLADLSGATSEEEASVRWAAYARNFASRFTPAGGVQRTVERAADPFVREANTVIEQALSVTLGAALTLPVRRDNFGRPIERTVGERYIGWPGGPDSEDPLDREAEALAFNWPAPHKTLNGYNLTAAQYSRFKELRGQIVRNPATGLNMEETIRQLIALPEYQALPPAGRVDAWRQEVTGFTRLATQALIREDHDVARGILRQEVEDDGELHGLPRDQREREYEILAQQLGLNQ